MIKDMYLEARKSTRDFITSWTGIFGPGSGLGLVQAELSSAMTITGPTELTGTTVETELTEEIGPTIETVFVISTKDKIR